MSLRSAPFRPVLVDSAGRATPALDKLLSTSGAESVAAASINALSDVLITAPIATQVIKFNGTNWVNDTDSGGGGGSGNSYIPSGW